MHCQGNAGIMLWLAKDLHSNFSSGQVTQSKWYPVLALNKDASLAPSHVSPGPSGADPWDQQCQFPLACGAAIRSLALSICTCPIQILLAEF